MASSLLEEYQHEVIKVNLRKEEDFFKLNEDFHTLTIYVNSNLSDKYQALLLASKPKRVIFNPGAENTSLASKFSKNGVEVINGCTVVMIKTNQFDSGVL